ncbi:MAG: HNH endonuclease [Nocardioides sp.]|nr:HNH endonuclease [Nocardioides sp.]
MFEVDSALQEFEVTTLEDTALLDLLDDDTHLRSHSDRKRLRLAVRFITNNRLEVTPDEGVDRAHAGWDEDGLIDDLPGYVDTLGGEGTPLIHITAPVYWAKASNRSVMSAKHYLANTMDLTYRYPKVHVKVETLDVPVWTAFNLCEATRGLSYECARWIDDRLAQGGRYGQKATDAAIKTGMAKFHPDLLDSSRRLGKDHWDVSVDHNPNGHPAGGNGTSVLEAIGDSVDLSRFLDAVNDEAATAGRLGDTDTLGQRKAKALGVLADRQATLDLAGLLDIPNQDSDASTDGRPAGPGSVVRPTVNTHGDLIHPDTGLVIRRKRTYGQIKLFVHLTKADLDTFLTGDNTVHADAGKLGPQSLAQIGDWLRAYGPDAKIQPVIDTDTTWAVDQHDPPVVMREQATQRDRTCVFPGCHRDSRSCDLDHINAYLIHGPPGQTNPENLAPLCRRHHLMKTHYGWSYVRNRDGTYTWTNPRGRAWLVTPIGDIDTNTLNPTPATAARPRAAAGRPHTATGPTPTPGQPSRSA